MQVVNSQLAGVCSEEPHVTSTRESLNPFAIAFREHRLLVWTVALYVCVGGVLLTALDRRWPIALVNTTFSSVWTVASLVWLVWQYMRSPRRFRRAIEAPRLLGAILVPLLIVPAQITFQAVKQSIGPVVGFRADSWLHHADVAIHGRMPWEWLWPVLGNATAMRTLDRLYFLWFGLLVLFVVWASWSSQRELRQRALIAFLFVWIGAGTITATVSASAGPCFYGDVVADSNPYAPLMAHLDSFSSTKPLRARISQRRLWEVRRADEWKTFGGISAMPSLHVAIAALFAFIGWSRSKWLGACLIAYACAIQIGSVALGWHYAVDGYIGALFAFGAWSLAGRLTVPAKSGPVPVPSDALAWQS
jgi:hypothetical protein